jgi:hypothetical protein
MLVGGRLPVFVSRGLQVVLVLHVLLLRGWVLVPVGDRLLPLLVVLWVLWLPPVLVRGQLLFVVPMEKELVVLLPGTPLHLLVVVGAWPLLPAFMSKGLRLGVM